MHIVNALNEHDMHTFFFLEGYCSTVQDLLDWFEVDLGFTDSMNMTCTHTRTNTHESLVHVMFIESVFHRALLQKRPIIMFIENITIVFFINIL